MDKTWIDAHNQNAADCYFDEVEKLARFLQKKREAGYDFGSFRDEKIDRVIAEAETAKDDRTQVNLLELALASWSALAWDEELQSELDKTYGDGFSKNFESMHEFCPNAYDIYLDQEFELPDGDYIITDPCYLMIGDDRFWDEEIREILPSMHMRDTIYGDWSCTLFKIPEGSDFSDIPGEERARLATGRFCADAGEVCCVKWDEVESYNPGFINELENDISEDPLKCHYAAVVRGFHGKLLFEVMEEEFEYKEKMCKDYVLIVSLDGTDSDTGEHVRYESRQTGF